MRPYNRIDRVNSLIQEELSKIIFDNFSIENVFITITSVDTSKDLIHAKVSLGIFPQKEARQALVKIIRFAPELQRLLNSTLRMRPVPKIEFVLDQGGERAAHIEKVLSSLKNKKVIKRRRGHVAK